jgi:hypothetical protein
MASWRIVRVGLWWKNGACLWAVHASTSTAELGVATRSRGKVEGSEFWRRRRRVVDLEGTAHSLFVAQEFQEAMIVLCSSTNEVHSVPIAGTELDLLAAVEEATCVGFAHKEVKRLDGLFAFRGGLGGRDVGKRALIRRAGKGAEESQKVVSASWASRYKRFCLLDIVTQ